MLSRQSKLYIIFPLLSSNNSKTPLGRNLYFDHWWAYGDIIAQRLQQELGFLSWGEQEALGKTHFVGQETDPETCFQSLGLGGSLGSLVYKVVGLQETKMEHCNLTCCLFSKTIVQFQELNGRTKRKLVSNVVSVKKPKPS